MKKLNRRQLRSLLSESVGQAWQEKNYPLPPDVSYDMSDAELRNYINKNIRFSLLVARYLRSRGWPYEASIEGLKDAYTKLPPDWAQKKRGK